MRTAADSEALIRAALAREGGLGGAAAEVDAETDLFEAGLSSLGVVAVLMRLENDLQVTFPDELVSVETFSYVSTIQRAVKAVLGSGA
jgi:acyl carrier protein